MELTDTFASVFPGSREVIVKSISMNAQVLLAKMEERVLMGSMDTCADVSQDLLESYVKLT